MKIGSVVRKYNIPVNRIYFYINNGLLVPPRHNNQYDFDERTLDDLNNILDLKQMGFSLSTIHRILSLKRLSNYRAKDDYEELLHLLHNQRNELELKEQELRESRARIDKLIMSIKEAYQAPVLRKSGLPIKLLPLLCCPICGNEFSWEDVVMNQRDLFQAHVTCGCGYSANVKDGIFETGNTNTSPYDKPDTSRAAYRSLPSITVSLFEHSNKWLESAILRFGKHGNVWLESYVNAYFFFHNHLHLLNEQDTLIVVDKFPETLRSYKALIDLQNPTCSILYIADASLSLPIRKKMVDCNMDFFATNEFNFYQEGFLLDSLHTYLKENANLFGAYFSFGYRSKELNEVFKNYPTLARSSFSSKWFYKELQKNAVIIDILGNKQTEFNNASSSDNQTYHLKGEAFESMPYWARFTRI